MAIPTGPDLEYARGDLVAITITFTQGGQPFDWTGFTDIALTVNTLAEPPDDTTEIIQMPGTAVNPGTSGDVDFVPPSQLESDNMPPGRYFYDVQGTDGTGARVTFLLAGNFRVAQDINKD